MSTVSDIKRILWNEIGHLCVDILKVKADKEIKISVLNISRSNYDTVAKTTFYEKHSPIF